MRISLDFTKTIEQNAAIYFEKAKKAKKKLEGAQQVVARYRKELQELQKKHAFEQQKEEELAAMTASVVSIAKKQWYEKFRWFVSSEGFLVIGGRDATTNEIIIKKHTDKEDFVFHTDMTGSPFFVIKVKEKITEPEIKHPSDITFVETASATGCFSRAWKLGISTMDVFYVKPEQVSKEAEAGEYMAKGSFMIRGKKNYVKFDKMEIAIGVKDNVLVSGPISAIKKQTKDYVVVVQGEDKPSDIAKKLKNKFHATPDDVIRMLPAGNMKIAK